MIKIHQINWLDKTTKEAEVILYDGVFYLECFSSFLEYRLNQEFKDYIHCLDADNIYKVAGQEFKVEKKNQDNYHLQGKLICRKEKIVKIGDFLIDISEAQIDGDIKENDYVEFDVARLDIY